MLLAEFLRYMIAGMIGWIFLIGILVTIWIFILGHRAWKQINRKR